MRVERIDPSDVAGCEAYDAVVDSCSLAAVQQTRQWAALSTAVGGYEPRFLVARDCRGRPIAGLPLHFVCRDGVSLLTSVPLPGALGGVVVADDVDRADAASSAGMLVDEAVTLGTALGCGTVSVSENPFVRAGSANCCVHEPDYVWNTYLQTSDLGLLLREDGSVDTGLGSKRNSAIRAALNRASTAGIIVSIGGHEDVSSWYPVFSARMTAAGTQPLEERLFRELLDKLGPDKSALSVARMGKETVGGLLTLMRGKFADVYALAASDTGLQNGAVYALCVMTMRMLSARGARVLSWESSPGRHSGVYQFKKHWGAREVAYRVLTWRTGELHLDAVALTHLFPHHFVIPLDALRNSDARGEYQKE